MRPQERQRAHARFAGRREALEEKGQQNDPGRAPASESEGWGLGVQ